MNYTEYSALMTTMLVMTDTTGQANLAAILPAMIAYAELKILRDLDLVSTSVAQPGVLVAGSRVATMTGIVVLESMSVITPLGATPDTGQRIALRPTTIEFINMAFPQANQIVTVPQYPQFFTVFSDEMPIVAPCPDAAYACEFVGTARPAALSPANPNTFISINLPDLMVSASMIFGAGYQKNFGAQSDDPKMALSWTSIYDNQMKSAGVEEARKKAQSVEWTAQFPSPMADQRR